MPHYRIASGINIWLPTFLHLWPAREASIKLMMAIGKVSRQVPKQSQCRQALLHRQTPASYTTPTHPTQDKEAADASGGYENMMILMYNLIATTLAILLTAMFGVQHLEKVHAGRRGGLI